MRPTLGVLILVLVVMAPAASAQGATSTSLALSGAGPVLDLTESGTRAVNIQVQFKAEQGFTCTGAAELTVDLAVTTNGAITASLNNATATFTIPAAQSPVQPYSGDAFTLLTVTKTAPHPEAEAIVTATYAGGSVAGCLPGDFEGTTANITVRTTALGPAPANASLVIASPKANAEDSEFAMIVSVVNFDLKPVGTAPGRVAGQGHILYSVDGKAAEGESMTPAKNFTFKNLAAGTHVLRAELVNNDHTPLSPPVFAEVNVKAVPAGTTPKPTTPATSATPTPTGSGIGTPVGEGNDTPAEDDKSFLPGPGVFALGAALGVAAVVLRRKA